MRERSRRTGPRTTKKNAPPIPVARGPVPRNAPQQPRGILRSYGPFLLVPAASIDIKVFQTFSPRAQAAPILHILHILHILLQTTKKARREK